MVLNTPLNDRPDRILKCGKYSEHIKLIETLQAASWLENNIQKKINEYYWITEETLPAGWKTMKLTK